MRAKVQHMSIGGVVSSSFIRPTSTPISSSSFSSLQSSSSSPLESSKKSSQANLVSKKEGKVTQQKGKQCHQGFQQLQRRLNKRINNAERCNAMARSRYIQIRAERHYIDERIRCMERTNCLADMFHIWHSRCKHINDVTCKNTVAISNGGDGNGSLGEASITYGTINGLRLGCGLVKNIVIGSGNADGEGETIGLTTEGEVAGEGRWWQPRKQSISSVDNNSTLNIATSNIVRPGERRSEAAEGAKGGDDTGGDNESSSAKPINKYYKKNSNSNNNRGDSITAACTTTVGNNYSSISNVNTICERNFIQQRQSQNNIFLYIPSTVPTTHITWDEVNAGLGYVASLLHSLASSLPPYRPAPFSDSLASSYGIQRKTYRHNNGYYFSSISAELQYVILPRGSRSQVGLLRSNNKGDENYSREKPYVLPFELGCTHGNNEDSECKGEKGNKVEEEDFVLESIYNLSYNDSVNLQQQSSSLFFRALSFQSLGGLFSTFSNSSPSLSLSMKMMGEFNMALKGLGHILHGMINQQKKQQVLHNDNGMTLPYEILIVKLLDTSEVKGSKDNDRDVNTFNGRERKYPNEQQQQQQQQHQQQQQWSKAQIKSLNYEKDVTENDLINNIDPTAEVKIGGLFLRYNRDGNNSSDGVGRDSSYDLNNEKERFAKVMRYMLCNIKWLTACNTIRLEGGNGSDTVS